jgi:hypothetical protein
MATHSTAARWLCRLLAVLGVLGLGHELLAAPLHHPTTTTTLERRAP